MAAPIAIRASKCFARSSWLINRPRLWKRCSRRPSYAFDAIELSVMCFRRKWRLPIQPRPPSSWKNAVASHASAHLNPATQETCPVGSRQEPQDKCAAYSPADTRECQGRRSTGEPRQITRR
jgi:hypothetical protein